MNPSPANEFGIRDARMLRRAVQQRWAISPEYRDGLIKKLMRLGLTTEKENTLIEVSKVVVAMERQNQLDEHKLLDLTGANERMGTEQGSNRFVALAAELGITIDALDSARAAANSDIGSVTSGRG